MKNSSLSFKKAHDYQKKLFLKNYNSVNKSGELSQSYLSKNLVGIATERNERNKSS